MKVWKMFFLFTRMILRFHVSFPGATSLTLISPSFKNQHPEEVLFNKKTESFCVTLVKGRHLSKY